MFDKVHEQALFPTYVWIHDLAPEKAQPLNAQLFRDLDRLTAPRPKLQPGENWQTEQVLHEREEFAALVAIITAATKGILDKMVLDYDAFEITSCWANISPPGAPHPPHFHPNNFLSGVYYVQTPPGSGAIMFHEPRPQVDMIAPLVREYTTYTAPHQQVPVQAGRLVMFPAWLTHSVGRNEANALRISISFNVMFQAFTETMTKPRWTGIPLAGK